MTEAPDGAHWSWPDEPYKGLEYYTFNDAPLFAGRDEDIEQCASMLTQVRTTILLLHGASGCGKSSFLRAGLIPYLLFRSRRPVTFLRSGESEEPIVIRCTGQPIDRLAEQIFSFTDRPRKFQTADGASSYDLSNIRRGHDDLESFKTFCRTPANLVQVFTSLSETIPYVLILILDQAEEILSLTGAHRKQFFDFLKLFNARPLNVQFIISLRTENFGEFLRFVNFEPSIFTDIKHYLLARLNKSELKKAIELPTSPTKMRGLFPPSPREKYKLEFEPGLVDRILTDLFAANPTGGILPAAQIVFRDLFNEIKNNEPRRITGTLYDTGGKVVRRVDNHIGRSLRSALAGGDVESRDLAEQEVRWRHALSDLAIYSANGTVRSDVKSKADVLAQLSEKGAGGDREKVLSVLTRSETLVLRELPFFASSDTETMYSLAHDSIGMALKQWGMKQDEVIKRQKLERLLRQRQRNFIGIGLIAATALLLGIWLASQYDKYLDSSVIRSIAAGNFFNNIEVTSATLLEAERLRDDAWPVNFFSTDETIKLMAVLRRSLPGSEVRARSTGRVLSQFLPKSRQIAFWGQDDGLDLVSLDPDLAISNRKTISRDELHHVGVPDDAVLRRISEVRREAILLQFVAPPASDGAAPQFIVAVLGGRPTAALGTHDFAPQANPSAIGLYLGGGVVYVWHDLDRGRSITAFFLNASNPASGVPARFSASTTKVLPGLAEEFSTGPGSIQVAILRSRNRPSLDLIENGVGPLALTALNFSKSDVPTIWEFATSTSRYVHTCFENRTTRCLPVGGGSDYFVLRETPTALGDAQSANDTIANQGTYLLIKYSTGEAIEIRGPDILRAIDASCVSNQAGICINSVFGEDTPLYFAGSYQEPLILLPDHQGIRIVKLRNRKFLFVGTAATLGQDTKFSISEDGRYLISYGDSVVRTWEIARLSQSHPRPAPSARELRDQLCGSNVVAQMTDAEWERFTGRHQRPPEPCAGHAKPTRQR